MTSGNGTMRPGKSGEAEDDPLDVAVESEGGFPCGEFLWMDDEEDDEGLFLETPVA